MYDGIGLQTPRGSGTSGYVQRNMSFIKKSKQKIEYRTEEDLKRMEADINRAPNEEILEHQRKRAIEVKCMEMREAMEEDGSYTQEAIEKKVADFRKLLQQKMEQEVKEKKEFRAKLDSWWTNSSNKAPKEPEPPEPEPKERHKERVEPDPVESEPLEDEPIEKPTKIDPRARKTKAEPPIYWLPLTEEEADKRSEARSEQEKKRVEEHERHMREARVSSERRPPRRERSPKRRRSPSPKRPRRRSGTRSRSSSSRSSSSGSSSSSSSSSRKSRRSRSSPSPGRRRKSPGSRSSPPRRR